MFSVSRKDRGKKRGRGIGQLIRLMTCRFESCLRLISWGRSQPQSQSFWFVRVTQWVLSKKENERRTTAQVVLSKKKSHNVGTTTSRNFSPYRAFFSRFFLTFSRIRRSNGITLLFLSPFFRLIYSVPPFYFLLKKERVLWLSMFSFTSWFFLSSDFALISSASLIYGSSSPLSSLPTSSFFEVTYFMGQGEP